MTPGALDCLGDCGTDGRVTLDELVRGVRIALGVEAIATCPAMDSDGDSIVTVVDLVGAVDRALTGCS